MSMVRKAALLGAFMAGITLSGAAVAAEGNAAPAYSPVPGLKTAGTNVAAAIVGGRGARPDTLYASCIEKGQTCTLHGTPCCGPYDCKGSFPNTTCK